MSDAITAPDFPEAHLLVVDDDREIRSVLTRFLNLLGYRAHGAASGPQALKMMERTRYDVAVVDIRMEGMDGVELMHRMRQMRPDLAIIVLTGYGTLDNAVAAVKEHAADYLHKPVSNCDIAAAVAGALEARAHSNRGNARDCAAARFLQVGPVTLDQQKRMAVVASPTGDTSVELTVSETSLLAHLMQRHGAIVSIHELAQTALAYDVSPAEAPDLIRPHIARLRKKIECVPENPLLIRTARGKGYVFAA